MCRWIRVHNNLLSKVDEVRLRVEDVSVDRPTATNPYLINTYLVLIAVRDHIKWRL